MLGSNLIKEIELKAKAYQFDCIGLCSSKFIDKNIEGYLRNFVSEGRHGSMNWMSQSIEKRINPINLWGDAKTAIILGCNYGPQINPLENISKIDIGNISVYARNRDYHKWVKGRLKNISSWLASKINCEIKVFVDTAPIMEKPLAQQAGIGFIGKHTNLISRQYGSWLFLGVILVNKKINYKKKNKKTNICGSCSKCIDICPTNAFVAPYKLDARKCISYLTIEHKGHIPREYRALIGNRIYGCDDCLAICPWNKYAKITSNPSFSSRIDLIKPSLDNLSKLDDAKFRIFFSGSPIKRIGRDRFVRNVLIAIGNSKIKTLLPNVLNLLDDKSILVQTASVWALSKICTKTFQVEKNKRINFVYDDELIKEWNLSSIELNG
ncbi:MAG: tRNA epoxyqueuosine(34) reductase QueG [Chloroflexi bacterium]|nr:tRNA epoxyqueuosine(34) reductase QueG [Chloroflexota bacterium]